MKTITTEVPQTTYYNNVTNKEYVFEEFKIALPKSEMINLSKNEMFKIRFYDSDDDFWDLTITNYNIKDFRNFLNKIVINK